MAEIGALASIVQVAGAGVSLSMALHKLGTTMAKAGDEINTISKGISLFSMMLKQVGLALKEADSVHSQAAVETTREIASQCTVVFDEIQAMVDRCQVRDANGYVRVPNFFQRFKWCFRKGRVEYLMASLDSLKLSLSVMIQVLHLGKTMASRPGSGPSTIREQEIYQGRLEVQNMVITRYYSVAQLHQLERTLEESPDQGDTDSLPPYESQPSSPQDDRLAISFPKPDTSAPNAIIKMPTGPLAEIDNSIPQTGEIFEQIIATSAWVVNSLLEKWTRLPHPAAPLTPVAPQNGHGSFREERQYSSEYPSYANGEPPQAGTRENGSSMPPRDIGLNSVTREQWQQPLDHGYYPREGAPSTSPRGSGLVNNIRDAGPVGNGDANLGAVREQRQQFPEHNYYPREAAPPIVPRDSGQLGNLRDAGPITTRDPGSISIRDAGLVSTQNDGQGRFIEDRRRLYLEDGKPRSRRSKKDRNYVQPQVESDSDDSEEVRHRQKSKSPHHSHRVLESDEDSSSTDSESEEERDRRRHKHRSSGEHKRRDNDTNRGSFSRPLEMPAFRRPNTTPNLHGYPNPLGQRNINYGGPPSPMLQPIQIPNPHQYRTQSVSSPMASPSGYLQHPPLQGHRSYPGPVQYPQQQHLRPPPPPDQQHQRPSSPNRRNSSRHQSRDKYEPSTSDKKGAVKAGAKAAGWAAGLATLLEGLDGL